jgi:hypothetical protein
MSTENSTEYGNTVASPPRRNRPDQQHGRVRIASITHTQAAQGADGSTVNLCVIPPGRGRILKRLSFLQASALGSTRTMDIGHTGWTKMDGTEQAAVADVISDGVDVSSATAAALGVGTNADDSPVIVYDSKDPITIQMLIAGGTLDAGETFDGYIAYVTD